MINRAPLAMGTWKYSVHTDRLNVVVNGGYEGKTLIEVIDARTEYLKTKCNLTCGFSILVKLIDTEKDLSVHVHTDVNTLRNMKMTTAARLRCCIS